LLRRLEKKYAENQAASCTVEPLDNKSYFSDFGYDLVGGRASVRTTIENA
jgi:hypothetical protein